MTLLQAGVLLAIVIACTGCEDDDNVTALIAPPDKVVRIPLFAFPYGPYIVPNGTEFMSATPILYKFNRDDYAGLDSIIYVVAARCYDSSVSFIVELYNITDDAPVASSTLMTSSEQFTLLESPNLLDELPKKEITLGMRVRLSRLTARSNGQVLSATLLLVRK